MQVLRHLIALIAPAIVALAVGCSDGASAGRSTMVFAASSLTEPFEDLALAFESEHPNERIDLHFAGTSRLVVQIQEGAAVDVFASADEHNMSKLAASGIIAEGPHVFARNRLTIITEKDNPNGITGLADLAREDLIVVLCGPEVPAGRYAREALQKAAIVPRSASDEPNVKAIVNKVRLGEVDAGVVYVTDTRSAGEEVDEVPIPDELNVIGSYPIAVLRSGSSPTTAGAFVAFVRSERGQAILRHYGFTSP